MMDNGSVQIARPPTSLSEDTWATALQQFCRASGLTATLYDSRGERITGPFLCAPLAQHLASTGFWEPNGAGTATERQLVQQVVEAGGTRTVQFGNAMRVDALLLRLEGTLAGVIVFGWVFDHFSDPLECERLARQLGISGHRLWSVVRGQRPISPSAFAVAGDLLSTLVSSNLTQLESIGRLQELSRMREEFLASVSHELRTPIQSVLLRLHQLLRTPLNDPDNIRRLLLAMKRSVEAEARLVEDLLDASRTVTGKLSLDLDPIRILSVAQEAFEASEPAAVAKGIDFALEVPPHLSGEVLGDASRLRQALWNLLANALKFTPPGGQVRLSVRETVGEVFLEVRDTGVGISAEFLPRLFEPFTQGALDREQRKTGLGLGLSIARHIVERHGGALSVFSEGTGRGATFTVTLPRRTLRAD